MDTTKHHLKLKLFFIILTAIALAAGCGSAEKSTGKKNSGSVSNKKRVVKKIDPGEAHVLITENQDNKDFVVLDVRTAREFEDGYIEGAINLDFYDDDFQANLDKLEKNKTYLVYCRSANRSGESAKIMEELGFKKIYDMTGGIIEWQEQGFPTVTNAQEEQKTRIQLLRGTFDV